MNRFTFITILLFTIIGCTKKEDEIVSKKLSSPTDELINYVSHCINRYDLCFEYPSNFGALPNSLNSDGKTFVNKADSATITIYGYNSSDESDLYNQLEFTKELLIDHKVKLTNNGYQISGILKENGYIFNEKVIKKNNGEQLVVQGGLQFTYPKTKAIKMESYWNNMAEKFK